MFKLKRKKPKISLRLSFGVQAERLELSHLAALDPKSSVPLPKKHQSRSFSIDYKFFNFP